MVMRADELVRVLQEERTHRPDLAKTLDLHIALVAARAEVAPEVPMGWTGRAQARLQRGETAVTIHDLDHGWEAVGRLAVRTCQIMAGYDAALSEALAKIEARLGGDPVDEKRVRAIVARYLANGQSGLPDRLDPTLVGFVLNQALHPFLLAFAIGLAPLLNGRAWVRGDCPVCGGGPDFAALEGEGGERRLLCARCDTEWAYRRLGCPFCANEDPGRLGYFPMEDGAYRLYVCERCKGYLKTIDLRETWRHRPLPVERILTVGMDLTAVGQGYRTR
jgi:FdhE protein